MTPVPQEHGHENPSTDQVSDDDIVISGVSGLLPNCESFQEFAERLYNKENMVTKQTERWDLQHPELTPYCGTIKGLQEFDAQFFTVNYILAHATEVLGRKLYEQAYQALIDSGTSPSELFDKRIGVYIAATICYSEKLCSLPDVTMGLLGRCFFANRISYWLNLKGPSITIDADSAGTLVALESAYNAIMNGYCDAAIVGSGKLLMHPQALVLYNRESPLNNDGKTKCYDVSADGQSLSEAINVIFLQKHKDSKRVYAVLKQIRSQFAPPAEKNYTELTKVSRDAELLSNFYREFYNQAGVSPTSVEYVEGFGGATPELDKLELQAFEKVFCKDRQDPLLVGSVASNIGFTDSSSAACGIFKILLAYQRGQLAANLHCDSPRQDIAAIRDGRMRIVNEHSHFNSTYTAVNVLTMTGVNAHALLQGYRKPKDLSRYHSAIPYLVTASGRQESSVEKILNDIGSRQLDAEEIGLIHSFYKTRISKHMARGFGIYSTGNEKTVTCSQKVDYYDDYKPPLWYVYSGMGSQWVGMGTKLMRIPAFAESIERCHKVLEPKGIDLIGIITSEDEHVYDNILHAFVGISAIQVALTDVLTTLGIAPDGIIGHSLGELGCAYADRCFSVEEVMLFSYTRGIISTTFTFIRGAMAAVGMGYKQLSKISPNDIDIACRNSATSSTISGPIEKVQEFVNKLTAQGVFAKEVQCANIAYHSRYIAQAGPEFLRMGKEIVKTPQLRSHRWISSSVPVDKGNEQNARYSSAEYHTNNLLNTVLFEDALKSVPANAVLVEIGPHGLLQAILKRAQPQCKHVPLTRRTHKDNAQFFLEAVGNLYMAGQNPNVAALYPKIEFPVSSGTRPLSHLVEWAHTEKWKICQYLSPIRVFCSEFKQIITIKDDEYRYFKGHRIAGTRVVPFAACLVAAWDTLAMTIGQERQSVSVQFEDVKFHCQPSIEDHELTYLTTTVQRGSGHFEVFDGNVILIEGTITVTSRKNGPVTEQVEEDVAMSLTKEDIYKLFYERGYEYKDQFRSIRSLDATKTHGLIEWKDNWVTFLDAVLQVQALRCDHCWVSQPDTLKRLTINVKANIHQTINDDGLLRITYDPIHNNTRCGGVTAEHVLFKHKTQAKRQSVMLQTLKFVPFDQTENCDMTTAINIQMQIVAENVDTNKVTLFYVSVPMKPDYRNIMNNDVNSTTMDFEIATVKIEDILDCKVVAGKTAVIFLHDLLSDKKIFEALYHTLPPNTYIISVGLESEQVFPAAVYKKISTIGNGRSRVELARFRPTPPPSNTTAITIRSVYDLQQLETTCKHLPPQHRLLVLAPHPVLAGVKEQVELFRKNNHRNVSMVMFDQKNAMDKELESFPDLAYCVLREGVWGNEYYVPTKLEGISQKGIMSLICPRPGDLSSLSWVKTNELTTKGVEVTVHYAGLVGYDASRAQAEAPADAIDGGFGMDFSGVTTRGERVMGLIARGSASSKVRANPLLMWPVPAHWSMEDAATVPYAYCYAFYLLSRKITPVRCGMSILVHGGSGALGQALISVALSNGLEVYTTVSDTHKKHFLKKLFPELKDDHIGNSRDVTFCDMIKRDGVNIVISCAKGELKQAAINCCGFDGIVLDTTQLVTRENFYYGLNSMSKQRAYIITDFSSIFNDDNAFELKWLQLMLSEGIVKGYVRPLSRVTYAPHETPRAFRLLAASRHRGRVLLALEQSVPSMLPRISCQPTKSYIIINEDEEFGLQFADLLIRRGAKKLIIYGKQTTYLKFKIQSWEKLGVQIEVSTANLSKKSETLAFLEHAHKVGGVEGVYVIATDSKKKTKLAAAVVNLEAASRKVCPNLKHFGIISDDERAWRDIVNERTADSLPSLLLKLPKLEQFDSSGSIDDNEPIDNSNILSHVALEAVEKALSSGDHVVAAYAQPIKPRSVLEEVAKIPGVNITNATVDRTRLEQVGIDYGRVQELCNLLQDKFNITVNPENVPGMTIGKLKGLKRAAVNMEEDVPGFGAYIDTVDKDEMRGTTEIVQMHTLINRSHMRADEFDVSEDTLCIIPGLEGHYARFKSLCERLKLPALVLQLGHNHLNDSLQEAAQRLADTIMKYIKPRATFRILGYDYGVLMSLEVAAILESYGMTGTVYLLGGTPEDICSSFNARWKSSGEDAMQDALIKHMYTTFARTTSYELEEALRKSFKWQEKVEALVESLRKKVPYSSQYIRGIVQGIYSRIKLLQGYDLHPHKLQSKIILMQAKPFKSSVQSLKPFTSQEPLIENLSANLTFAYRDLNCANIINTSLSRNILEAYDRSNQCNTSLINSNEYIKLV